MRRLAFMLAMTLATAPAFGGVVYVPMLGNSIGGLTLTPHVLVANSGTADRNFTQYTIALNADGVTRPVGPRTVNVGAGDAQTVTVDPLAGMVEFGSSPDMAVTASFVAATPLGAEVGEVAVPIIDSTSAFDGGRTINLLGLQRDSSSISMVAIANVSQRDNTCSVKVLDAKGEALISSSQFSFKPLSLQRFADPLQAVPGGATASARVAVSCTGQFHAFAVVVTGIGTGHPLLAVVKPSATGASLLYPPGEAPTCGSNATCFSLPGLVFQSTTSDPDKGFEFAVPAGSYRKLTLKFEFFHGGWNPVNPKGAHGLFYMVRNINRDMIGSGFMKGPGVGRVQVNHGIDLLSAEKYYIKDDVLLTPGTSYLLEYVWAPGDQRVTLTVRRKSDNQIVASASGPTNVSSLPMTASDKIILGLSNPGTYNPEPASLGTRWYDLSLELQR